MITNGCSKFQLRPDQNIVGSPSYTWHFGFYISFHKSHPAGDVTRVSVMPRKVTVKIGDSENRCRWCRDKNQWKRTKILVRLVLYRVPFKSGAWNLAYKMPKYVLSLLVKRKLKTLLSVLRYRLPRFRGKRQNQRVATFWRHKSIEFDRLNYKLVSICGPFKSKNKTW